MSTNEEMWLTGLGWKRDYGNPAGEVWIGPYHGTRVRVMADAITVRETEEDSPWSILTVKELELFTARAKALEEERKVANE